MVLNILLHRVVDVQVHVFDRLVLTSLSNEVAYLEFVASIPILDERPSLSQHLYAIFFLCKTSKGLIYAHENKQIKSM